MKQLYDQHFPKGEQETVHMASYTYVQYYLQFLLGKCISCTLKSPGNSVKHTVVWKTHLAIVGS